MKITFHFFIAFPSICCAFSYSSYDPNLSKKNVLSSSADTLVTCSAHMSASYPHISCDDTTDPVSVSDEDSLDVREEELKLLDTLCALLGISAPDVYFSTGRDGERGMYTKRDIETDNIIMKIPLSSCIRDDQPPSWLQDEVISDSDYVHTQVLDPSKWATRLASSLIDKRFNIHNLFSSNNNNNNFDEDLKEDFEEDNIKSGIQKWLDAMPNPEFLRASLPVHWSEETLLNAKCTALELAVDSSYFARGEAVHDIIQSLQRSLEDENKKQNKKIKALEGVDLDKICQDVLDIVQTRSCRLEAPGGAQWGPPLRVLAPVFDYINHGSSQSLKGAGFANAYFGLEKCPSKGNISIVVRARTNISSDEEILVDYGVSAHPAWRCLASYGFVPEYGNLLMEDDDEEEEDTEVEDVAEVYMNGRRFEVGRYTIPTELVETAYESLVIEQNEFSNPEQYEILYQYTTTNSNDNHQQDVKPLLSPIVATRLAKRISDAAFALLLHSEKEQLYEDGNDSPNSIISERLAAALRWSQHRVLRDCADSLREYSTE